MHTPKASSKTKRPNKIWWLIGVIVLMACIVVQMPAVWLVNQFMPNSTYLQHISGNIWQGSSVVQLPTQATSTPVMGTVTWKWKPLSMLLGKISIDVEMLSGQTRLQGVVNRSLNTWQVVDFSGKIDKQTLSSILEWQLPEAPIQVNALSLVFHQTQGFKDVEGQLTWAGGDLGYPSGGKYFKMMLPPLQIDLSQETRNDTKVVHANLVDNKQKRLGDFYLDKEGMLDVGLTQRLLENMSSYTGNAPADTVVVSVRQPLFKSASAQVAHETSVEGVQ